MSEQTNDLLSLFSKLLHSPRFMVALRMTMMRHKLHHPGGRKGAQGLLVELWKQDGLTNAEIAELLDIKPSSVTVQVNQLEEAGLVERRADENDGRVSRVFLTEAGNAAQSDHKEQYDGVSEDVFNALSLEEQAQLKELIQKLVNAHADDEWSWDETARPDFRSGFGFNPRDFHRAMHDMRRAGRDMRQQMKEEIRQKYRGNHRNLSDEELRQIRESWGFDDFWNWKSGSDSNRKAPKTPEEPKEPESNHENWDDF